MSDARTVDRRSVLLGGAATAAGLAVGLPSGVAVADTDKTAGRPPLWKQAERRGLVFGSSTATWQISDPHYRRLFAREAGLLFTEDDLLWYQLKPKPDADVDFTAGDKIIGFAERQRLLTIGAHLVWDEGFGGGWKDKDLWGLNHKQASKLLFGVIRKEVKHYKGRMNGWIVANEVTDPEGTKNGIRTNVPWYNTIGPAYITHCFNLARRLDPKATLLINEFGFETVNQYGDTASSRQRAFLKALDHLIDAKTPIDAVGIQAHLLADRFKERFHERSYRAFFKEIADRGLKIMITEMDVLDDSLPKNAKERDRAVADVYARYLDVALDERAVKTLVCFGLSDRFTWLDEDYPRDDGSHRRPLAFDRHLKPKPSYFAISNAIRHAPDRNLIWQLERGGAH